MIEGIVWESIKKNLESSKRFHVFYLPFESLSIKLQFILINITNFDCNFHFCYYKFIQCYIYWSKHEKYKRKDHKVM
jgi:hypothetical protein